MLNTQNIYIHRFNGENSFFQRKDEVSSHMVYALPIKFLSFKMEGPNRFDHNMALRNSDRLIQHYIENNQGKVPDMEEEITPSFALELKELSDVSQNSFVSNVDLSQEADSHILESKTMPDGIEVETSDIDTTFEDSNEENQKAVDQAWSKQKMKSKRKKHKFKLQEFSGISAFSKWLLSFKQDNVEKLIKKEQKALKKRALEASAKKSITKSDTIISEHLAMILANQGHLDEAKKMYRQLMIKYPEKSSYFAAKIDQLI